MECPYGFKVILVDVERNGDKSQGDVIPLQFLGTEDVDVSRLSSNELLLHALTNLGNDDSERVGGYAVRHGANCCRESTVDDFCEQV